MVDEEVKLLKDEEIKSDEVIKKYEEHLKEVDKFQERSLQERETSLNVVKDAFNEIFGIRSYFLHSNSTLLKARLTLHISRLVPPYQK